MLDHRHAGVSRRRGDARDRAGHLVPDGRARRLAASRDAAGTSRARRRPGGGPGGGVTTRPQQLAVVATCLLAAMTYAGAVTTFALAVFVLPAVAMAAAVGSFFAERHMFGTAIISRRAARTRVVRAREHLERYCRRARCSGDLSRGRLHARRGCGRAVALARILPCRGGRIGVRRAAARRGRRGTDRCGCGGRRGRADARLDRAVAAQLDCAAAARTRARSAVVARRCSGGGSRAAAGAARSGTTASARLRPCLPWDQAAVDRPLGHDIEVARHDSRRPAASRSLLNPRPTTTPAAKTAAPVERAPAARNTRRCSDLAVRAHRDLARRALALSRYVSSPCASPGCGSVGDWRSARLPQQIIGAWAWMRIRLEACRLPLPAAASPDVVAAGGAAPDLPAGVRAPLQALAASTTTAAFANGQALGAAEVTAAWRAADRAEASARELLTRPARVGLAFRGPRPRAEVR